MIAARAVRRRASKTRNSVTSGPTHPGTAARRSDPMRRAASGLIPIVRKARENLAATKSSLAARRIATATGGIGARARILVAGIARATRGIAAIQSPGRSAMHRRPITPGVIPAHHVMAREVSTSPVMTKRVPRGIDRFGSGPNSTAPARIVRNSSVRAGIARATLEGVAPGRSIHAVNRDLSIAMPIGRAATTRTMLRFSPSVPRSAAVAPIASARPISTNAHRVRRARRNPASASPRWCRGQGWPRAVTPRNGLCRAASRSMAA